MSKNSPLVLEGDEVKLRLQAERTQTGNFIHIDWLRFTVFLRNVVPSFQSLPDFRPAAGLKWEQYLQSVRFASEAYEMLSGPAQSLVIRSTIESYERERRDPAFQSAATQAFDLARDVAKTLGPDFTVNTSLKKGQDFYRWRFSIERSGHECAWVGFLAASESPHVDRQNQSVHVNIQGHACTFATFGWREKMANLIELHGGKITRADLALDLFGGLGYDFMQLLNDYKSGAFDVRGKRPGTRVDGDWANGQGRSFYIGNRKSGKETNVYEKGDQLFGAQAGDAWVRSELRYGDQLRCLPTDLLRRPDDFFAGASNWHAELLLFAGTQVIPQPCPQDKKLELQSVLAEVHRNVRWLKTSAAPTIAAALQYMSFEDLLQMVNPDTTALPGRLKKFAATDLTRAYQRVISTFTTAENDTPRSLVAA